MKTPALSSFRWGSRSVSAALIVLIAALGPALADQPSTNANRVLSDVTALEGSAQGGVVVALHRGEVAIFNATTLAPITTFYPPSGQPISIGLSPNGVTLAIGLNNSSILLYNTSTLVIEAWGQIPSTPYDWVTALRWSPDGTMLAVRASDGKLRILDASLGPLANFTQQSEGPIEWAQINGTLSAVTQGSLGVSGVALWHLDGTVEPLTGQFYSSYGDATWTMWPDGRFLAIQAPRESQVARLFASADFGRNPTVVSHAGEFGDFGVAANPWTGEFATFGGASRITFWRANATPYAELPTPDSCYVPPNGQRGDCVGAFAWIGPEAAIAWNQLHSQLFRIDMVRSDPAFGVTIDEPANGSTVTGDFVVGGHCTVIDGGTVWVRADGMPWQKLTCKGVWYATLNATYWRPGNHTLFAALFNGTVFSQWATLQVFRPTDYNSTAMQPTIFWTNPESRMGTPFYSPLGDLRVGGYSPNTADARLLMVWFRVDGSPWQEMLFDGRWSHPLDPATLSRGFHTFEALGWDGVAFSDIAFVSAFYNVEPAPIQFWATIDSPAPESILSVASVFQGQWGARNLVNGSGSPGELGIWVDVSVDGGPWLKLSAANASLGHWNFTLPSPFALSSTLTFCVRTSNATRLGNPTCAAYYAPSIAVDLPPSISITNASGHVTTSGSHNVIATGTAHDDYGVVAVLFRVDGGNWLGGAAAGVNLWTFLWTGEPNASGNHTIEAVAYDGFRYSPVERRDVHIDLTAAPTDDTPKGPNPPSADPGTSIANFLVQMSLVWVLVAVAIGASAMYWIALRRRRPGPPE